MFLGDGHAKYPGGDPKRVRNGHIFKKTSKQVTKTDFDQKVCVPRGYSIDVHGIRDNSL